MSQPTTVDGTTLLSADLAAMLAAFPDFTMSAETIGEIRSMLDQLGASAFDTGLDRSGVVTTDHPVPDADVVVRVHRPAGVTDTLPGIYTMHGGGYVIGSYAMDDDRFARWCPALRCVGFSVEYRLAPDTAYPGPLEDCYAGLVWAHEHHDELGVDPQRLGISGLSAGGGLAAALALLVKERGGPPIAFQLLECPMLDDRQLTVSSRLDKLAMWNRESNTYGWQAYLGPLSGQADVPITAAPGRATVDELADLPPAFVAVGGADGFRDEDVDYAVRLSQAGVPTELHVYPGAPHGVSMFPDAPVTTRWNRDAEDWLARHLRPEG